MPQPTARRNTRQRQVVLEELRKVTSHPTASELHQVARQRLPKISLGTVYRNLELLTEMGLVQKLDVGGSEARFDANTQRHLHVRCLRCGRMDDIHGGQSTVKPSLTEIAGLSGYEIYDYRLDYIGICPQCREPTDAESTASPSRGS